VPAGNGPSAELYYAAGYPARFGGSTACDEAVGCHPSDALAGRHTERTATGEGEQDHDAACRRETSGADADGGRTAVCSVHDRQLQ